MSIAYLPMVAHAQQTELTAPDHDASVAVVSAPYHLHPTNKFGAVWIILTDGTIGKDGKTLSKGEYGKAEPGDDIVFSPIGGSTGRLATISVQAETQPLTIDSVTIGPKHVLADASDRNTTLLVALNDVTLTDTISSGEMM